MLSIYQIISLPMNVHIKIAIILIAFPLALFSQQFYYSDLNKNVHLYDMTNCHDSIVINIQFSGVAFQDITFAPDGNLYAVTVGNLYLINQQTGAATLVNDWCPNYFCYSTSLISDAEGNIYAAGDSLYVYNIFSGFSANLGAFPQGIVSAGDMTFYAGQLYLTTSTNDLVAVDIENPENSQIVFAFNTNLPIVGISNFFISCDSSIAIGVTQFGEMYWIDIENQTTILAPCSVTNFQLAGLATPQEYLASNCTFIFDLDGDDSSGQTNGNYAVATCILPAPITDTDFELQSGYLIDSIVIENDPNFDLPYEYCAVGFQPGISYYVNNANNLVFANLGNATAAEFKAVLATVRYHNDSPNPAYGIVRDIKITVWSASAGQQLTRVFSVTYWPLPMFSLGMDTVLCPNNDIVLIPSPSNWPNGYEYEWQDGSTGNIFTVTAFGEYSLTISADFAVGCSGSDSVQVTAGTSISTQSTIQLCTGESITLNGQAFTSDTTVCTTYSAFSGCDSTHCTTVVFTPLVQSTISASICQGSSFPFNGQLLTMSGTYLDTIASSNGCDTLLQLDLAVLSASFTSLDSAVCQGDSVSVGGQFFSNPGLHTVVLPSNNGCDSTVALNLSVLQNTSTNVAATICEGSSYTVGGMMFSSPGLHTVTLPNWQGCDSTVNLSLTVQPAISINLDTAICEGQSLIFFGQNISQPGSYEHTATSPTACDTVYNLTLSVLALPTVAIIQSPNGCAAASVLLSASSSTAANVLLWSNAATGPTVSATSSGQYSVTATDANGCSSAATTIVSLAPPLVASIETSSPKCANDLDGWIEVLGESGGIPPYSFAINGGPSTSNPIFEDLGSGTYEVVMMDNSGCTWDTIVLIAEPPVFQVNTGPDQTIQVGAMANLSLNSSSPLDSIWWVPTDFLDCTTCQNPTSTPDNSIEYQVFALDSNGCLASDMFSIIVLQPQGSDVYAPNAFSPNGDGINDAFTLFGNEKIEAIENLTIFDRWGGMVFYAEGIAPNDLSKGWTGEWRGKQANQGVYTWMATVKLADGTNKLLAGDVTLLR